MELNPNGLLNAADKTGWSPERVQSHMEAIRIINNSDIYSQGAAGCCDFGMDDPVQRFERNMDARALRNRQKLQEDQIKAFQENRDCNIRVSGFAAARRIGPPTAKAMARHSESELQILRR